MPKLYTKKGDKGLTSLFSGERIAKNGVIFDVLGTIDELQASIGIIIHFLDDYDQVFLRNIQRTLIKISSDIATSSYSPKYEDVRIGDSHTLIIEKEIDRLDSMLPTLTKFILVGTSQENAFIHQCRVVTRKSERMICSLYNVNPNVLKYINRLSDYFFALARYHTFKNSEIEIQN